MKRAALLIGVKKTGNLPELRAVTSSVNEMALWAKDQGIEEELIRPLTDDHGPVTVQQIKDEIKKLVDLTTIEQLIVYFSGHGFNIESEFWLLSDAPRDVDAAVNVDGSVRLARYCGIPHVLLISDCCRSAAEGLQAMQVREATSSRMTRQVGPAGPWTCCTPVRVAELHWKLPIPPPR